MIFVEGEHEMPTELKFTVWLNVVWLFACFAASKSPLATKLDKILQPQHLFLPANSPTIIMASKCVILRSDYTAPSHEDDEYQLTPSFQLAFQTLANPRVQKKTSWKAELQHRLVGGTRPKVRKRG
jgi:hypothetical protein